MMVKSIINVYVELKDSSFSMKKKNTNFSVKIALTLAKVMTLCRSYNKLQSIYLMRNRIVEAYITIFLSTIVATWGISNNLVAFKSGISLFKMKGITQKT